MYIYIATNTHTHTYACVYVFLYLYKKDLVLGLSRLGCGPGLEQDELPSTFSG